MYEAVMAAKKGPYSRVEFITPGSSAPFDEAGPLLAKLNEADLQRLAESARNNIRADAAVDVDVEEAARLYRKAAELNPYDDIALMSYAILLTRQGKIREALPWAERAAQVNPKSERTRRNLEGMRRML
jgi:tetratricopeptide (TPR) repeat protein